MTPIPRSSPLSCLVAFFGLMLLAATAVAGIAAWLAYLRPDRGIEWPPLAWLTAGFLAVAVLVFSVAWYRIKNGGSSD